MKMMNNLKRFYAEKVFPLLEPGEVKDGRKVQELKIFALREKNKILVDKLCDKDKAIETLIETVTTLSRGYDALNEALVTLGGDPNGVHGDANGL